MSNTDLTTDEFAVLLLADDGASMMPIGRWEKPVKALASLGLLRKADEVNYVITPAGSAARQARDAGDEADLQRLLSSSKKAIEDGAEKP